MYAFTGWQEGRNRLTEGQENLNEVTLKRGEWKNRVSCLDGRIIIYSVNYVPSFRVGDCKTQTCSHKTFLTPATRRLLLVGRQLSIIIRKYSL